MLSNKGVKLAFLTAIISGFSIFINKFAVGAMGSPLAFTAIKNTAVALLVISLLIITKKLPQIKSLKIPEIIKLSLIGIIGGALPFYLFFTGLSQIPAINAAIIHKSLILWIAILAYPFLKEKLSPVQILAIITLFASNLVVGGFKSFTWSVGEWMILTATILWAIENIIAKKTLNTVDPDIVVAARMGIGAFILLSLSMIQNPTSLSQVFTLTLIQAFWISATAITLLAYNMTWYRALKHAPATLVATILVSSTIVTNILSAIFITHIWTRSIFIQSLIITISIALIIKNYPKYTSEQIANWKFF